MRGAALTANSLTRLTPLKHVSLYPQTMMTARLMQLPVRKAQRSFVAASNLPIILSQRRLASTISTRAPTSSAPGSTTSASTTQEPLRWDTFFALRRRRRVLNTISSSVTGASTLVIGTAILSGQNPETFAFGGVDPMFVMALSSIGAFLGGWLVGPVLGGVIWRLSSAKGVLGQYMIKERDFFDRIKRFRVDPTSSSVQNPVPDYYGEKIRDVKGYRAWLKDQRAFNRKRRAFV